MTKMDEVCEYVLLFFKTNLCILDSHESNQNVVVNEIILVPKANQTAMRVDIL